MSKQVNMTEGSLGDKIIKYAVPLAATGVLQQLFNAADIAVVGQFAKDGKAAMAAVGSNSPVVALLVNFFVGISLGTNVFIARAIGQNHKENIKKAVHTSLVVAVMGGVFLMLLGLLFSADIVKLLGVPEDVYGMAVKYLRFYLCGMPVILLYNFEAAIFRSCGNTKIPFVALAISGVTNVLLNMLFVLGFGMDSDGVAIATVISNLISSSILFVVLLRTDMVIHVDVKELGIDGKILKDILKIGVPSGIQSMIFSFANIVIQSSVNSLGTTVIAASAAAFNLEIFAFYVMNSFGQACTTFTGQNFGAGKNERCLKTLKLCLLQCFFSTLVVCLLILAFAKPLLHIFNGDAEVIEIGYMRLQMIFFAYLFSFAQEILSGYLRGYAVSFIPALCSVVGICGVRLVWIFTVFQKYPSFRTIMLVYPISLGLTTAVILLVTILVRPSQRFLQKA